MTSPRRQLIGLSGNHAFKQDPDRYVPQYGGFCAFGVSVGKKFDGDPILALAGYNAGENAVTLKIAQYAPLRFGQP